MDREFLTQRLLSNNPPRGHGDSGGILSRWLWQRLGAKGRVIYATGSVEASDKYKSKPVGYQPDMGAYLDGRIEHIYGSWLRREDGTTFVLAFDLDRPEHHALHRKYQEVLDLHDIPSVYWRRGMSGRRRGHLELYFDQPVDADRAHEWILWICPALAEVSECFPAHEKRNSALSWPMYQRVGNQVAACVPVIQLPGQGVVQGNVRDRRQLSLLIQQTIIPSSQVETFDLPEWAPTPQLSQSVVCSVVLSDPDIVKQVIANFNASHSWEDVTKLWGGVSKGRFHNGERGERTASVVIDPDGQYACDYGDIGDGQPRKLDKYEVWIRANRIDKRADLRERCRAYRLARGERYG